MICNVPVTLEKQNLDFIIYNLILAKEGTSFTTQSLFEEVRNYDENVTEQFIQKKIEDIFLMQGLVRQKFDTYCVERQTVGRR